MSHSKSSSHFTVDVLDQLSHSLRISEDFRSTGPLKGMDPERAGAFAAAPGSLGQRNAVRLASGSFRVSTLSAHPNIVFAYDNPSVRFGDRTRASSRPVSKDGATSFHFAHSFMSKTSPVQNRIREFNGGRTHFSSKANDHLLYIERDGAAEKLGYRRRYDGLDGILDNFEGLKEAVADRNAQEQQDYLERAGAAEKMQLRNLRDDEIDALETASFGTIGRTIEERHHFWQQVEGLERNPRGDKVKLEINHDQRLWDLVLGNRKTAPEPLKAHLDAKRNDAAPEAMILNQVATPKALAIYKWVYGLNSEFPIKIEPGRGGRIQNRIIAELPHELDPHERVRIVRDFTSAFTQRNLPFWAVIHAPDENNDRRNYHVHIVYYDRPAAKMPDPNSPAKPVWDFEIVQRKRFGNRHVREVRPHMQDKDREVSEKGWVKKLRELWESALNAGLCDAGHSKRYDARTYREMGIDLEPLKHIPSKTFNKERKGDLTPDGVALARRQWDVLLEKVAANNSQQTSRRRRNIARNAERVERLLARTNPNKALATREAQRIAKIADKCAVLLGHAELCQDVTRVIIDRVASRARLVFHAAFGDADKKPRGRPRKKPLALPTRTNALRVEAEEARQFLKAILPEGKRLDDRKHSELQQARQSLAVMSRRLEELERHPTQHPNDRRRPGYVDLDRFDPSPEEIARLREEALERLQESVMALAEKNLTEALKTAVDEALTPASATGAPEMKTQEPQLSSRQASAETLAPQPVPPPAAPATGPGSRPAYLDEKNPKGTRYRYEPFSIRPDRPQKAGKPASTIPASPARNLGQTSATSPTASAAVPVMNSAAIKQSPASSPAGVSSVQPAADAPKDAPQVEAVRPVAAATVARGTREKLAAATPVQQPTVLPDPPHPVEHKPAVKPLNPPAVRAPNTEAAGVAPHPKPKPKGSFTLTQRPTRTTPSPIHGLVVEGAKPKPQTYGRDPAPTPSGYPVEKGPVSPVNPIAVEPERQSPITALPAPMKPPLKRGKKKGSDRNDRGPDR